LDPPGEAGPALEVLTAELRVYPRLGYAIAMLANETSFDTDGLARLVVGP
jgi:hypothetical protein